jgi:hypothetical protein
MTTCKCGYTWNCRSQAEWICCPNCHRKFRRPVPRVEVLGRAMRLDTTCDVCGGQNVELNLCRIDGEAAYVCEGCLTRPEK